MTVIATNVSALRAAAASTSNAVQQQTTMNRLSTGVRVNSAADDAAGFAIGNKMSAQVRGLNQAVRNANDGISLAQTAQGDMSAVMNSLQRMRELAVQAANNTNATTDMTALQSEFSKNNSEIDRVSKNSAFNTNALNKGSFDIQVGAGTGANNTINVSVSGFDAASLTVNSLNISTAAGAGTAISTIDTAINTLNAASGSLGADQNRLTAAVDSATTTSTNISASRSRIMDTDYAAESTALAKESILSQASTAMLAQANQQSQTVLSLLK